MGFKIVGVAAMARHGKDTVANTLVERCGFTRISLADKLKEEVAEMFKGYEGFDLDTLMNGDKGPLQRRVLQIWGTEARRHVFEDFWLWRWAEKALEAATSGVPGVVIADIRFPNEADYVHSLGGIMLGVDRGAFRDPETDYTHASEKHIPEILKKQCNDVLKNLGTLADLAEEIDRAIHKFELAV